MIRKIKICIMLPYHFSHAMGGAEYQVKLVIDKLIKLDYFDIYYLCDYADKNYDLRRRGWHFSYPPE